MKSKVLYNGPPVLTANQLFRATITVFPVVPISQGGRVVLAVRHASVSRPRWKVVQWGNLVCSCLFAIAFISIWLSRDFRYMARGSCFGAQRGVFPIVDTMIGVQHKAQFAAVCLIGIGVSYVGLIRTWRFRKMKPNA